MKVACPVWEGLQEDRVVRATYGVLILLHPDGPDLISVAGTFYRLSQCAPDPFVWIC
jgi:hypothetical protein